ncbi:uncharacterized protein BXZ73DRAFT_17427, partial [Epithele typhae]|uniref:uncharacterized protein n=1 Tax=Epithele typhae TaxID=378194 RepID=UPI00200877F9
PNWMVEGLAYLKSVNEETWWHDLVGQWLAFEEHMATGNGVQVCKSLPAKGRPEVVKYWLSRGRQYIANKLPTVKNPSLFSATFERWWRRLQPAWRQVEDVGQPLPREVPPDGSWSDLALGGPNGLFVVLMCLAWW